MNATTATMPAEHTLTETASAAGRTIDQAAANFVLSLVEGAIKPAMKDAGAGSGDLWLVPAKSVHRIEGFNVRERTPEYLQHIRSLADSMKSEGFYRHKPLAGYVAKVEVNGVVTSQIFVTDGYTRLEAAEIAKSEGVDVGLLPVVVSQKGVDAIDLTVGLVRANGGRPLTPIESAKVVKRLIQFNVSEAEVAKRLGFSTQYVADLLSLIAAPIAVLDKVRSGEIAATLAVEMVRKHGPKVMGVIEEAQSRAAAQGKTRITKQHTEANPDSKFHRRQGTAAFETIEMVKKDPAYEALDPNTRAKLDALLQELEKHKEAAAKKAKASAEKQASDAEESSDETAAMAQAQGDDAVFNAE